MAPEVVNPYESPRTLPEARDGNPTARPVRGLGPAIDIASCAFLGGLVGVLLLMHDQSIGLLSVVPGAILGGLCYRLRSRHWPVDPRARARRFGYALAVVVIIPGSIAAGSGIRGQGLMMIALGLIVGLALAAGILISGDRRPITPTQEEQEGRQGATE